MDKATRRMFKRADRELLGDTTPSKLRSSDEDELVELHKRVRRARNNYAKLYRRRSSAKVKADRSRAVASTSNRRTAAKAEVFEDALARVSRELAKAARRSADQLRDDRLAAAKGAKKGKAGRGGKRSRRSSGGSGSAKGPREKKQLRTPARKRAAASSRAANRRKEAKRAAR